MVVYSIIMVLIWPGNWIWDEKWILELATTLSYNPWQHVLTSVFYIFSLMVFPSPVIIVIIQYTIISCIVSFFVGKLYSKFGKKSFLIGLLFVLPSVIAHIFYPMRLILFAFVELLFLFLLFINKDKDRLSCKTLVFLSTLNIILAVWRTECIFFVLFLPLFFLIKKYPKRIIAAFSVFVILSSGILTFFQNSLIGDTDRIRYNVTGIVVPFHELFNTEYFKCPNSPIIQEISTYIDINEAVSYTNGEKAYWQNIYKQVNCSEKYRIMLKNFKDLVIKYPHTFIYNRINTFLGSMCHWDSNNKSIGMIQNGNVDLNRFDLNNYYLCKPINLQLRSNFFNVIYANTDNNLINSLVECSFNLIVPIILLFFLFVQCFIKLKKKIVSFLIFGSLLIQCALVFLTAPGSYFMYYFPVFICGYSLFFAWLLNVLENKKRGQH